MGDIFTSIGGLSDIGQLLALMVLVVGIVFSAMALMRIVGPIGEGVGSAVSSVGNAVEQGVTNVTAPFAGVGNYLTQLGAAAFQSAKNDEESFSIIVDAGDGRKVQISGHGYSTAPKLAGSLGNIPQLPAGKPPAGLLGPP